MDLQSKRKELWGSQTIVGDYTLEVPADGKCTGVPDEVARKLLINNRSWERIGGTPAPATSAPAPKPRRSRRRADSKEPEETKASSEETTAAETPAEEPKRGILDRLRGRSEDEE